MDDTRLGLYNRIRGDVHTYSSTLTAEVSSQIAGDIEGFVNHPADECVNAQRVYAFFCYSLPSIHALNPQC